MGTGVRLEPESKKGKKAPEVTAPGSRKERKVPEVAKEVVVELLNIIEQHKRIVLSSPFVLAVILWVAYAFGGTELRRVLDFMSPGHFLAH